MGKIEPIIFYLMVLLYLIPVLAFKYFPTIDGPAHLYNSKLISELWTVSGSPILSYFEFNPTLTPNWSGHFLLSTLISFLPAFMAEKITLVFYLAGLPLSIRFLCQQIRINNPLIIYLVFPFTYSFLFYYGFYNYDLGLVFLFWGLGLWIKLIEKKSILNFTILLIISSLICLSHLFVFGIFLLTIFFLSFDQLKGLWSKENKVRSRTIRHFLYQFACVFPGVLLLFSFLLSDKTLDATTTYLSFQDLLLSLKYIMPVKGIEYDQYVFISKALLYTFTGLVSWLIAEKGYAFFTKKEFFLTHKNWLFICLTLFLLIFIFPDYIGASAGFISARLVGLFFLFLVIWLATQVFPKWLIGSAFFVITLVNINVIIHNFNSQSQANKKVIELEEAAKYIEDYAVVLPVLNSSDFLDKHISNYLGVNKPMVILENYEAAMNHFPLIWNYDNLPFLHLGNPMPTKCLGIPQSNKLNPLKKTIDYICIIGNGTKDNKNTCYEGIIPLLKENYKLTYATENRSILLYQNKLLD